MSDLKIPGLRHLTLPAVPSPAEQQQEVPEQCQIHKILRSLRLSSFRNQQPSLELDLSRGGSVEVREERNPQQDWVAMGLRA